jgi:hypothetical protein
MTTSPHIRYNKTIADPGRTAIFCDRTGKILGRVDTVSLAQLSNVAGGSWLWCRGCHMEHYVLWSQFANTDTKNQIIL